MGAAHGAVAHGLAQDDGLAGKAVQVGRVDRIAAPGHLLRIFGIAPEAQRRIAELIRKDVDHVRTVGRRRSAGCQGKPGKRNHSVKFHHHLSLFNESNLACRTLAAREGQHGILPSGFYPYAVRIALGLPAAPKRHTHFGGNRRVVDPRARIDAPLDALAVGTLHVLKQEQSAPNDKTRQLKKGNFATAYIDHGRAPKQAGYEYVVYVQPSNKEINRLLKKDEYQVIRRDNTAHVVKDLPTGITGYVCFEEYAGDGLVRGVTAETIVMERTAEDGSVVMSVCTPDLGITEKGYTTRQESQPLLKEVRLDGAWELTAENPAVECAPSDAGTLLKVTCRHGQPVEFHLIKK